MHEWYASGASPSAIHERDLPCNAGDRTCPMEAGWNFDPDDYDILLGHYSHIQVPLVTKSRGLVVDEFPGGAFETTLDNPQAAVSDYLAAHDELPFEDYADLMDRRHDAAARERALDTINPAPDEDVVFDSDDAHSHTSLAVYALLTGEDLRNGIEVARTEDKTTIHNRRRGSITILDPPDLTYATAVVGLDGTPTHDMWVTALNEPLNHKQILTDEERVEFIGDVLGLRRAHDNAESAM